MSSTAHRTQNLTGDVPQQPSRRKGRHALDRRLCHTLLRRLRHDVLVVHDHTAGEPETRTYGRPGELHGEVVVHDQRAYRAVARGGSAGLGRGFVEGWWSSSDPVAVVRILVRNMRTIDEARNRAHRLTGWLSDRVRLAMPRDTMRRNKRDIAAHYDLGNEFFALFLDETMTYSSAVFHSENDTLTDASRNKYDRLLAKLGVADHHHLLEIGTGWGGLAVHAASTTGCRVTTTTISDEQLAEARRRVDAAGCSDRVTLLGDDWRELSGTYDRAVSIEMIEAVDWREYDDYFRTIEKCLRPDGLVALQAICLPDRRWPRAKNTTDFIKRYVFPNGYLPSVAAISRSIAAATRMNVIDVEDLGAHYAETLRRWRVNFDDRSERLAQLDLDERFCRLWRFYLAYCEAGFRERHCTVVQIVIAGHAWRGTVQGSAEPSRFAHPRGALAT